MRLDPEPVSATPSVLMFTAPNPGPKTLSGTHAYLLGTEPVYLVDPGPDMPEWTEALATYLRQQVRLAGILLTHTHPDHAPAAAPLADALGVPVWASPFARSSGWPARVDSELSEGTRFPIAGDVIEVLETPGHTSDHVAFWLPDARILLSGDTILGEGTTLIAPPEGDMRLYMETLQRLRDLAPRVIAPGHGPIVRDPIGKIEQYIEHRAARERQIIAQLERGPASVAELVTGLYSDVDPHLHGLAAGSVSAQLEKLHAEGRVEEEGGRYRLLSPQ